MNRLNKSKKEGKDQESIQSSTTPDPGYQWESDNVTIRHHKPSLLFSNIVGYFEIMLFDHFVIFGFFSKVNNSSQTRK